MRAAAGFSMTRARHGGRKTTTVLWGLIVLSLLTGVALIGAARFRGSDSPIEPVRANVPVPEATPPKTLPEPANQKPAPDEPVPEKRGRVALIIDDVGFSLSAARQLAEVKIPVTWSIIPYQAYSLSSLKLAKERDIPVMLHLPMEAEVDRPGLKFQINLEMGPETVRTIVRQAVKSLPGVIGLNNHRGSRATSTPRVMEAVLAETKAQGLFFVDSWTSGKSVGYSTAIRMGVPALRNDVFLDHDLDQAAMRKALERAFSIARRKGYVVVIAHIRPETLRFLKTLGETSPKDVKWVTVPEIIRQSSGPGQGGVSP